MQIPRDGTTRRLSQMQRLIWAGQELDPESPIYNSAFRIHIPVSIDRSNFELAFREIVARSETLRTTVVMTEQGIPVAQLVENPDFEFPVVDLSGEADPFQAACQWCQAQCERLLPMDGLMFESALLKLGDEGYIWFINQHHLICDAWGVTQLYRIQEQFYQTLLRGESLPSEVDWQFLPEAEGAFESGAQVSRAAPPLTLYGKTAARIQSGSRRVPAELDADAFEKISCDKRARSFSKEMGQLNVVLTLLYSYLSRIGDQRTIRIGVPFHHRLTKLAKESMGPFIAFHVHEVTIDEAETFASLLKKVQTATNEYLKRATSGETSSQTNASFNVVCNFINASFTPFGETSVEPVWLHPGCHDAEHHLRLHAGDFEGQGKIEVNFDFNQSVFDATQQARAVTHFGRLLSAMAADMEQPIAAVEVLCDLERELLDRVCVAEPSQRNLKHHDVVQKFDDTVTENTNRVAVVVGRGGKSLTYGELAEEVDKTVERLHAQVGKSPVRIAVCLPRGIDAVVAMLAILKSGSTFVPMDPLWPASRKQFLLGDGKVAWQFTDGLQLNLTGQGSSDEPSSDTDDAPAYILYTSGSTGQPKGVEVSRAAMAAYVGWAAGYYGDGSELTFPLFTPLTFDLTLTSIFVPLISGGQVVVYPRRSAGSDLALLDVVEDNLVNIIKLTPSHLSLLANRDLQGSKVRQLILGGEDLKTELVSRIASTFSGEVMIHNEYGPTEATVGCIVHSMKASNKCTSVSVPIGRPIGNMQALVLNESQQPVPIGVAGELYIGGDQLADGYFGRPELTASRFVDHPHSLESKLYRTGDVARVNEQGIFEYLGRRDQQVKIRGARIELGAIETALQSHPEVSKVVVTTFGSGMANQTIDNCSKCGLASNYPGVSFDQNMVCNQCNAFESYREQAQGWFQPLAELEEILAARTDAQIAGSQYDCMALLSGGKDSTYMLGRLADMGLRVLAFTLDNGYISEQAKANIRRVVATLGVDHVFGSTPAMNEIFVDSLKRHSNVCQGCFKTIYTLAMNTAKEKKIPFLFTGLSRGQFFETRLTEDLFKQTCVDLVQIDQTVMEARKAYHRVDDAVYRNLDVKELQNEAIFKEVQILDFYRYCDVDLDEMYQYLDERLPWVRPSDTGRSTNCLINDVGIYVHKRREGFHNYALPYAWDVRMGHKQRAAALEELDDDIDVENVHQILNEIGYDGDLGDPTDGTRLVAYYVSEDEVPSDQLTQHVSEQLPAFMLPSRFIRIDEVPLSENGKVDTNALPDPRGLVVASGQHFVAPQNETEEKLAQIWAEVIGVEEVGIRDNFFELGGDSIQAIQIVARSQRSGIKVSPNQFFESLTVEKLAASIDEESNNSESRQQNDGASLQLSFQAPNELVQPGVTDVYPLSPMQQGMLFHAVSEPGSGVYVDQVAVSLHGALDQKRFADAIRSAANRHSALRTTFVWEDVEEPLQVVHDEVDFSVSSVDWCDRDTDQARSKFLELIESNRRNGFDLASAPLLKFTLIQLSEQKWTLLLTFHHLVLDGWATHVLLKEITDCYRGELESLAEPFEFKRYLGHLQNFDSNAAKEYWRQELSGFENANSIGPPLEQNAENDNSSYLQTSFKLSPQSTQAIKAFARGQQVTLNTVVQAAFALTISRYAGGADDVVFGTTVAGRPHELDGIENAVGSFINTLPLRIKIAPDQMLGELLSELQCKQADSRRWELSSLVEVQKLAGLAPGASLFESILVFENYPAAQTDQGEIQITSLEHFERSNFPLALLVVPRDELEFIAVHDTQRYSAALATRLIEHVGWLLERFAGSPEQSIDSFLDLPPAQQLDQLAANSNGEESWADEHELVRVDDLIEKVAIEDPLRVAAVFKNSVLTYGELDERAEMVAKVLRESGLQPGGIVGVCVERSFEMLIGILAAMKADAAYLPMDPSYPESHLKFVINDARLDFVLANSASQRMLPQGSFKVLDLDEITASESTGSTKTVRHRPASNEMLAYVIYTSGSTGQAKGVMISHANLAVSTKARREWYGEQPENFLLLSSFAFDSSVAGIFGTLTTGGTLVLPEPDQEKDVESLADLIQTTKVSQLLCLPSLYRLIVEVQDSRRLESLKIAIVAGEAIGETAATHFKHLPETELHNEYGPTEATVWASVYRLNSEDCGSDVPIGKAVAGTKISLIGNDGKPVAQGTVGEICVSGPSVAKGYLNRDQLNKDCFVEFDFGNANVQRTYRTGDAGYVRDDGQLMFCGRIDRQVKIRGHRIEPQAVEHCLGQLPAVEEAFVGAHGENTKRLVAWLTADADQEVAIQESLNKRLPSFMVPDVFVFLDSLPRLANGKIDASSLPEPHSQTASDSIVAPQTETEKRLAEIWEQTIGVSPIGVDQNFFALGGDSIVSIQIISRARRAGIGLKPKHIAQFPTIAELATIAEVGGAAQSDGIEGDKSNEIPLSPIQDWFLNDMKMPEPHHWNQSVLFELEEGYDTKRFEQALRTTVSAHPMLWARFQKNERDWRQTIGPQLDAVEIETESVDFSDVGRFHAACLKWQSSLNLEQGPLFRLVSFSDRSSSRDRLLFVAHHLVVDTVSWQILIDDLVHLYESELSLPQSSGSYAKVVDHLKYNATSVDRRNATYWQNILESGKAFRLPLPVDVGSTTEGNVFSEIRTLSEDETQLLLTGANEAFNTRPEQLMLAALALAITDWTEHAGVAINLESHGRDSFGLEHLDLVRTVGWMTAMFPVTLDVDADLIQTVKRIKDQLNEVTSRGVEYGALKRFGKLDDDKSSVIPQILWNYLGVQSNEANALIRPLPLEPQSCRANANPRQHALEIAVRVRDGKLVFELSCCSKQVDKEVASKLASGFIEKLIGILEACSGAERVFTASDFAEAELSQTELDEFLDSLD